MIFFALLEMKQAEMHSSIKEKCMNWGKIKKHSFSEFKAKLWSLIIS